VFEDLLERVRGEISGERALESVRSLAGFHRIQGSPGYDEAADWLRGEAERVGLEITSEQVAGDGVSRRLGTLMPEGWECHGARARVWEDGRCDVLADWEGCRLAIIQRSAPAAGRFPLVALEDGTEETHYEGRDVRGAVVLTSGDVRRVHELAVVERGAAGLLADGRRLTPPVREAHHDRDSLAYTSFWWAEDEPRGWGFVLSPASGERLRGRLALGARLEVEVAIDTRFFATRLPLLSTRLFPPGPEAPSAEILVVAHLCHPQPGANDNASGVAAALEAARALAACSRRGALGPLRRAIRFLWVPEITGTCAWLAGDPFRAGRVAAALDLDMVGEDQEACGSTLLLEHPPVFAGSFAEELLRAIRWHAQDWVTSYSGPGHFSLARLAEVPYSGGSDHAVLVDPAVGVPCPLLIQWPDRFYHSSLDTPERCDPRSLALAARCAATYAGFLAGAGEREIAWLGELVARGARRRLLEAAGGEPAGRRLEAERVRGQAALSSLTRLGAAPSTLRGAARALDGFCRSEGHLQHDEVRRSGPAAGGPRVARLQRGPLDPQRHLLAGWRGLSRSEREEFRRFEAGVPGGPTLLEVAWYACDGRRTLDEVAHLVWLETGHHLPGTLERFLAWAVRLGLAGPAGEDEAVEVGT
jgi:hypothetical protein